MVTKSHPQPHGRRHLPRDGCCGRASADEQTADRRPHFVVYCWMGTKSVTHSLCDAESEYDCRGASGEKVASAQSVSLSPSPWDKNP